MNSIAELKVRILRQQQLAAELARNDHKRRARDARTKLFGLLNQLDVMQESLIRPWRTESTR